MITDCQVKKLWKLLAGGVRHRTHLANCRFLRRRETPEQLRSMNPVQVIWMAISPILGAIEEGRLTSVSCGGQIPH